MFKMTPAEARAILGLAADATMDEIESAYQRRSRFIHPDRFSGRPESDIRFATAEFQRIGNARDLLRGCFSEAESTSAGADDSETPTSGSGEETFEEPDPTRVFITIPHHRAVAGNVIRVQSPSGENVSIRLPRSFDSKLTVRIKGRGDRSFSSGVRPDLLVTVVAKPVYQRTAFQESYNVPDPGRLDEDQVPLVDYKDSPTRSNIVLPWIMGIIILGVIVGSIAGSPNPDERPQSDSNGSASSEVSTPEGSIEFYATGDYAASCPDGSSSCWVWQLVPEESCENATISVEFSKSSTSKWSERTALHGQTLIAGTASTIVVGGSASNLEYADISSVICRSV
ncbi:J domain-containing protein [Arthrobacter sp. 7Tela_A1]|uniref:J domain-containing protein n=1 Tax=Arthrobacter sp. 7Tela_A1 TaxID=3093745 RepID=UPI003BB4BBF4